MHARTLAAVTVVAALSAPAAAEATNVSITATGTAQVKVIPTDRHSNASIAAAEAAAAAAGVPLALSDARTEAGVYAAAAGLTLGPLLSISDQIASGAFYGPSEPVSGPFGPGKFCGTERVPIGKPTPVVTFVGGQKVVSPPKRLRFKKVHRCIVPSPVTTTLVVTYSAS
jgi:hypothetical protein